MHEDRLALAIENGSAVLVIGAGASMSLSGGAKCADWLGLVIDGIERVGAIVPKMSAWKAVQEMALEDATERLDIDALVGVAGQIAAKLKSVAPQAYSDWLRDSVGSLAVVDPSVARSLANLKLPLLTTNFDTLLEAALDRTSVSWANAEGMRAVFKNDSESIGHLHGVWTEPSTVIFSGEDYEGLIRSESPQFIQRAHYATKSFIYVGLGGGLQDPNFSRLIQWQTRMFPDSRGDHFRLCRDSESDTLEIEHGPHDIRVVQYGKEHSDLSTFLERFASISPASRTVERKRDQIAYAREAIVDQIRAETIAGQESLDADQRELSDLTVPPVLLPLPHEQFASTRALDDELKAERIDASDVFREDKLLILAGEELSGVSTALRWIVSNAAFSRKRSAPLYIDSRSCAVTPNPLTRQVQREALSHRLIDGRKDQLPGHVLAIDNVLPREGKLHQALIEDILASTASFIVLGCRQGDEFKLASELSAHRLRVETVYLGKLGKSEISALAKIIAPKTTSDMSSQVLDVIKREHLPRTPFTASLLLVLLSQGVRQSNHNSETAVLDDYVSLLLGRGGPYLDPRFSLDPQNRETVLSELAKQFVRSKKGALTQADVVSNIQAYFASVSWKEDPIATLDSFRRMRILRVENEVVQFQQSSYLHLFAAKAAIRDRPFLESLLDDPLFYAPIVRHYAALVRGSDAILRRMSLLLGAWEVASPTGTIFARIVRSSAPDYMSDKKGSGSADGQTTEEESDGPSGPEVDSYDYSDDADLVPFPLVDPTELSRTARLATTLDLVSRVLRDSDQVANLDLKNRLFLQTLDSWGQLLDLFETDSVFDDAARVMVERLAETHSMKAEKIDELVGYVRLLVPSFVVYAGISACLASRKLLITLENTLSNPTSMASTYGPPMAAMFAFDLQEQGWARSFPDLVKQHGDRWVVSDFIGMLATLAYKLHDLSPADEEDLKKFLLDRVASRYAYSSEANKLRHIGEYEQNITRERVLNKRKRLSKGSTIADSILGITE